MKYETWRQPGGAFLLVGGVWNHGILTAFLWWVWVSLNSEPSRYYRGASQIGSRCGFSQEVNHLGSEQRTYLKNQANKETAVLTADGIAIAFCCGPPIFPIASSLYFLKRCHSLLYLCEDPQLTELIFRSLHYFCFFWSQLQPGSQYC